VSGLNDRVLTAGALFAGIGGFCIGFERAGIGTSWAIENDPMAVLTYRRNNKHSRVIEKHVRGSLVKVSPKLANAEALMIHGGGSSLKFYELSSNSRTESHQS
jgi:site-specific DNA-cytosine methylase